MGDVGCEGSENQELSCNDQDCPGKKLNRTLSFTSRAQKSENRKNKQKNKNLFSDGDKGGAVFPFIPKDNALCVSVNDNKNMSIGH